MVLSEAHVHERTYYRVDSVAKSTTSAVRNRSDTHVRSTNAQPVTHIALHLAMGDNTARNQCSLREADDVELSLEMGVFVNFLAPFICLVLEVL